MSGDVTAINGTTALLVAETRRAIAYTRNLPGDNRVGLLGHSMATDIIIRASMHEGAAGQSVQAVVAPGVEHVGVLFSLSAVQAAQDWFDTSFYHASATKPTPRGWWILALLSGIVLGFYPLAVKLMAGPTAPAIPTGRFVLAILIPVALTPLLITPFYRSFLPVLVADYLMLNLALLGIRPHWPSKADILSAMIHAMWGIAVFGLALDRYAANFLPTMQRLPMIAALCLGTIPCMLVDTQLTQAGRAALWRRLAARLALFASLIAAALPRSDDQTFVLIVLPVFVLFFLVDGLLGRWVGQRAGAWAAGVGFPLFTPA
jgi:hypothetical protein